MTKWEYLRISLRYHVQIGLKTMLMKQYIESVSRNGNVVFDNSKYIYGKKEFDLFGFIDQLGNEEWELVNVGFTDITETYFFKRPIRE